MNPKCSRAEGAFRYKVVCHALVSGFRALKVEFSKLLERLNVFAIKVTLSLLKMREC